MSAPPSRAPAAQRLPERIGPFSIRGILGRGGMGVVFEAETAEGQPVALKVIRPAGEGERAQLLAARFLREARILAQLDHPGIVRLVDAGDADGLLYLAMERIEGTSLLTLRRQAPFELQELVVLGARLASALAHMHDAGVVHRDIKPANILVNDDGHPVITDFGISGLAEATGITRQGDLLGSPGFIAPEIVEGRPPSPASDQYSLGRLLFELGARGAPPLLPKNAPLFDLLSLAARIEWSRLPGEDRWPELGGVLRRMLSPAPEDRFPDAHAAEAALLALASRDALELDTVGGAKGEDHAGGEPWEATNLDFDLPAALAAAAATRAAPGPALPPFPPAHSAPPPALFADVPSTRADAPAPAPEAPPLAPEPLAPEPLAPEPPAPGPALRLRLPGSPLTPRTSDAGAAAWAPSTPAAFLEPAPADPQVTRLERQVARLREELETARAQQGRLGGRLALALLAGALGAALGAVGADALPRWSAGPVPVILVPALDPSAAPLAVARDQPITAQDLEDARGTLEAAKERLGARDLDGATRLLGLCIELADLPECHRVLGATLGLVGDPAARIHLKRHLELAPDAPGGGWLREALER